MKKEDWERINRGVSDALYVLSGKWRLPILIALAGRGKRYGELAKEIPRITDRMLSKELRELELNMLIRRTVLDEEVPMKVEYSITEHGKSLHNVVIELSKWGELHRKVITQK